MNSLPPTFNSAIFNTNAFSSGGFLTKSQADLLYAPYSSVAYLSLLYGVTPGIISASKAVIVDSNKDITGYRNITATGTIIATTLTGTLSTAAQPNITSLGTLTSPLKTLNSAPNSLAVESSSTNTLNNSSFTSEYDLYIKRNQTALGTTAGIAFLHTDNEATTTLPSAQIITTRVALSSADMTFHTTNNERFKIASNGVCSFTNTTTSTSSATGALLLSGGIGISNTTDASSSTNGGSITTAGGVAIAKKLFVGTTFTLSGIQTSTNTTTSTSSATGALLLSGGIGISNTTDASSSINGGSMTTAGGVAIAKKLFVGTSINTPSISTSSLNSTTIDANIATIAIPFVISHLLSSGVPTPNSFGVGMNFNGPNSISSTVSYGRIYSTIQSTTNGSHQGSLTFASVFSGAFQDVMSLSSSAATNNLVDIKGSASTLSVPNITTTTMTSSSGTVSINSKLNVNSPTTTNSIINIQSAALTSHLNFAFDTNHYAYMSCGFDSRYTITVNSLLSTPQYHQYWFDSPEYCSVPRLSLSGFAIPASIGTNFRLQFGNTTGDIMIALYNANTTSPTYGFGVNNSSIQYVSAGSNGHRFFSSSALGGAGAPIGVGTNIFNIQSNGNTVSLLNTFAGAGVHAFGFDTTNLSSYGPGAHMHYAASKASFFGYDYSGGGYKDLSLNNDNLYIKSSSGYIGIGTTSPSCPLHVSGTGIQSTASTFGFLSNSGSGVATGFTNRAFSIRSDGGIYITAGEIDVTSDERFKNNINVIDDQLALDFISKIKPIVFSYKNAESNLHYGYSAQELVINKFNVLVGTASTDEPLDKQVLINDEGESITIPSDTKLIVNLLATIPLLHRALQLGNERIKRNEEAIAELRELIKPAQEPAKLKRVVKKLNRVVYSSK